MKVFLLRFFMIIGIITVAVVLIALIGGLYSRFTRKRVPPVTILEADLTGSIVEYRPPERWTGLLRPKPTTTRDVVGAIRAGAHDSRVRSMIARVGGTQVGMATVQEIRNAVLYFRSRGKKAIAFAETFGEGRGGNRAYYLATAFDSIYLVPSGNLGLIGFATRTPFAKQTLDKLGVKPQLAHRKEYKSAIYTFTQTDYTEPHREEDRAVLESFMNQLTIATADARDITRDSVRTIIDEGPYSAEQALELGLVDALGYRDEVYERVKSATGTKSRLLYLTAYRRRVGSPYRRGKTIALIYGVGSIYRGKSRAGPVSGVLMGAETVTAAFREAIEDKSVRAILFRVNSPGGSYVASDLIWRETIRARDAGKPVIVSMGDVAGSGGYFVAAAADKIVAHPATITGSIGVVSGKLVTTDFWEKLGLNWGRLEAAENAAMWSSLEEFSPEQWAKLQEWLDRVYTDFVGKVAQGRNLPLEQVREAAKGRIWSGADALEQGLVDSLGGMPEAIALAKKAAGIPEDKPVRLKLFPPKKTFLERMVAPPPPSSERPFPAAAVISDPAMEEILAVARRLGSTIPTGVLSMRRVEYQ
jgi:protease-4